MGDEVQTIKQAWGVYDRWLEDPSIAIWQETLRVEAAFRAATLPVARLSSPKALGDCYLLAASQTAGATLVTLDHALASACEKLHQPVTLIE